MWVYDECKQCLQLRQLLIKDYPQITIPSHSNVQITKDQKNEGTPSPPSLPSHCVSSLFLLAHPPLSLTPCQPFFLLTSPPFPCTPRPLFPLHPPLFLPFLTLICPPFLMSCPPPSVSGWYNYYNFQFTLQPVISIISPRIIQPKPRFLDPKLNLQ